MSPDVEFTQEIDSILVIHISITCQKLGLIIIKTSEKSGITIKFTMLSMAMLLCGLLFLVTNSFANTADSYVDSYVENSGYTLTLNSSKSPATSSSTYSASTFEHNRQAAQWFMAELVDNLQSVPAAD